MIGGMEYPSRSVVRWVLGTLVRWWVLKAFSSNSVVWERGEGEMKLVTRTGEGGGGGIWRSGCGEELEFEAACT